MKPYKRSPYIKKIDVRAGDRIIINDRYHIILRNGVIYDDKSSKDIPLYVFLYRDYVMDEIIWRKESDE